MRAGIHALVESLQRCCDKIPNANAIQVAEVMHQCNVVVHDEDSIANDRPVIGAKTLFNPHYPSEYEAHYITAYPQPVGRYRRRWQVRLGLPSPGTR